MTKIKILKDTPFDRAEDIITLPDFRAKYGYISSKHVSDTELLGYMREEIRLHKSVLYKNSIAHWFEVIEEDLPLGVMYKGLIYRKEVDGMYHGFIPGTPSTPEYSVKNLTIEQTRRLIEEAKFKDYLLCITDVPNQKI